MHSEYLTTLCKKLINLFSGDYKSPNDRICGTNDTPDSAASPSTPATMRLTPTRILNR